MNYIEDNVVLVPIPNVHKSYKADVVNGRIWSETSQRWLNPKGNKRFGYVYTTLKDTEGNAKPMSMHVAIFTAYLGTTLDYFGDVEVEHVNLNKEDNRIENLELVSRKEQYTPEVRAKLGKGKRLTKDEVIEIKKDWLEWQDTYEGKECKKRSTFVNEQSEKYGTHALTIDAIVTGKSWKNVKVEAGEQV